MVRFSDVEALVERRGGRILHATAGNWAWLGEPEALARLEADAERWRRFIEHEVATCAQPGALDDGTHILFAARPRSEPSVA